MSGSFDEKYFSSVYRNYNLQNPPNKIRFYHSLAHKVLNGKVNPEVLEIGCAKGAFLKSADANWNKTGCDTDYHLVKNTAQMIISSRFLVCKLPQLPFYESFDLITAFDVLEHVNEIDDSMLSIRSSLKENGSVVMVIPVYDGICGPLINFLDKDPTHIHKRSRRFWLDLIGKHFDIIEWFGITRYYLSPFGYLHLVTKRLRLYTPAIAILGSKKNQYDNK